MRVGLIGDIHANLPALEAVLAHAAAHGIARFWNTGDWVGYGPFPDEVVWMVRDLDCRSIAGNFDLRVLEAAGPEVPDSNQVELLHQQAFRWALDHLSPESRGFLAALPEERRFDFQDHQVLLTHGSPISNEERLTPATPQARLQRLASIARADLVVCGHSHRAFHRRVGQTWFLNPGSVGRPDDGDPRAGYAILTLEPGRVEFAEYRVAYDLERCLEAMQRFGLPVEFGQMLIRGRGLGSVLGRP